MNGRVKCTGLALMAAYLGVWPCGMIVFWCLLSGLDAMGYWTVFIWGVQPIAIFGCALLMGIKRCWGMRRWIAPLLFGILYMLAPYLTFSLANTMATGRLHPPELGMILVGSAISIAGLVLGRLLRSRRK